MDPHPWRKKSLETYTYHTISNEARAEFRDRGSRFIGYAFPLESIEVFRQKLKALKKEHPKAVHHCFAYRLGTGQDIFRSSDDGEPPGTAGKPILGQIDSRRLTNVLIVVVRYFGGTLLGVPGLIHAYKTASSQALDQCTLIEKPILVKYRLEFDYTQLNDIMRLLRQHDCRIEEQEMQLFSVMIIGVPLQNREKFERSLGGHRLIKSLELKTGT